MSNNIKKTKAQEMLKRNSAGDNEWTRTLIEACVHLDCLMAAQEFNEIKFYEAKQTVETIEKAGYHKYAIIKDASNMKMKDHEIVGELMGQKVRKDTVQRLHKIIEESGSNLHNQGVATQTVTKPQQDNKPESVASKVKSPAHESDARDSHYVYGKKGSLGDDIVYLDCDTACKELKCTSDDIIGFNCLWHYKYKTPFVYESLISTGKGEDGDKRGPYRYYKETGKVPTGWRLGEKKHTYKTPGKVWDKTEKRYINTTDYNRTVVKALIWIGNTNVESPEPPYYWLEALKKNPNLSYEQLRKVL